MKYAIVTAVFDTSNQDWFYRQAANLMDFKAAAAYAAQVVRNQKANNDLPHFEIFDDTGFRGMGTCGWNLGGLKRYVGQTWYDRNIGNTPEVKYILAAARNALSEGNTPE